MPPPAKKGDGTCAEMKGGEELPANPVLIVTTFAGIGVPVGRPAMMLPPGPRTNDPVGVCTTMALATARQDTTTKQTYKKSQNIIDFRAKSK